MSLGTVISLCDRTGNMVKPWLNAGYKAITVDLQESELSHPAHIHKRQSVSGLKFRGPFAAAFAFPPCTHLASSGARWFKSKGLDAVIDALAIVNACKRICEESGAPWMLENPVGTLATYWRDPDYTFHPVHYSGYAPDPATDEYTKKTCLWTGGGFVMPDRKPGEPTLGGFIHRMPPSEERSNLRSITPMGFAVAVFQANAPHLARAAIQSKGEPK
jgi:hypothetical protein